MSELQQKRAAARIDAVTQLKDRLLATDTIGMARREAYRRARTLVSEFERSFFASCTFSEPTVDGLDRNKWLEARKEAGRYNYNTDRKLFTELAKSQRLAATVPAYLGRLASWLGEQFALVGDCLLYTLEAAEALKGSDTQRQR